MFTPRGLVGGSFQLMLRPRKRASKAAFLVSCAFMFVFSWYRVIIALSLHLSLGALQYKFHISIIATKIVSIKFFLTSIFWSRLEAHSNKNSTTNVVSTKCRLRIYTFFFFVWYMITCHLTTNRASRNHFFAIIFHDYLHYCGILLATSLIIFLKHNFKPSYSLFALCISWLVWCLYRIYQLNMSPLNIKRAIFEKQLTALHVMCLFC